MANIKMKGEMADASQLQMNRVTVMPPKMLSSVVTDAGSERIIVTSFFDVMMFVKRMHEILQTQTASKCSRQF